MYLTLAYRNIWRNRRRTLITILSITFAVLLACIMRSMQLGSYDKMIENSVRFHTGYIQIHKKGYWDDKVIDNSMPMDTSVIQSMTVCAKA
jgi:ABC-type antimicrobial peptide transport system permease subunit